jgi:AbrB family looped-hinge helix DNA binding protein
MRTTVDSAGRIVVPKTLRDALGLQPGTDIDISTYGLGLTILPLGRTARLETEDGFLGADGGVTITDDDVFALMGAGRR